MHDLALQLALIGVAGIAAQWLAWRVQVPAIILWCGVINGIEGNIKYPHPTAIIT